MGRSYSARYDTVDGRRWDGHWGGGGGDYGIISSCRTDNSPTSTTVWTRLSLSVVHKQGWCVCACRNVNNEQMYNLGVQLLRQHSTMVHTRTRGCENMNNELCMAVVKQSCSPKPTVDSIRDVCTRAESGCDTTTAAHTRNLSHVCVRSKLPRPYPSVHDTHCLLLAMLLLAIYLHAKFTGVVVLCTMPL
jgi:hypothetical protein